jgi:hypothetical protein
MVSQAFNLGCALPSGRKALRPRSHLVSPVGRECLQGVHDPGVQDVPPLLEEAAVDHFVRQGMLEGVFAFRKEPHLIQKLGRLEVCQPTMQRLLGQLSHSVQQRYGHLAANHDSRLQEALCLGRESVDARRQHGLYCGWHLHGRQGLCQMMGTRLPDEHPSLDQGAHALFQEEGITIRAGDQKLLERRQTGIVPKRACKNSSALIGGS